MPDSSSNTVLLTGATGFLGMEVLARLLDEPDTYVLALIRAGDDQAAEARLRTILETLGDQDRPGTDRVRVLRGDITARGLGLSETDCALVNMTTTHVVHCAASIEFTLPLEEAREINVGGTANVLAVARDLHAAGRLERFVHVSTAYVAGRHEGVHREADLHVGQTFRNSYEQSKSEAEELLRSQPADLPLVVARPSIVVGDRSSGWTPAFNVIYWPLQAFARGLLDEVPADPDALVDIVPVDYVADALVALRRHPDPPRTVSLVAGERAATNRELIALTCSHLQREPPRLVDPGAGLGLQSADVYLPYFDVRTRFDDHEAQAALGNAAPPLDDYIAAILDYAKLARWGKQPLSRRDAVELTAAQAAA
jgi:thioester reductase-like protein